MADIEYTVRDRVATILLNRPHRKNAFTLDMVDAWADLLLRAGDDPEVRVIVVTGAGGAFCSGIDLGDLTGQERGPLAQKEMLTGRVHRVARALEQIDKPVIAAVPGAAVGAGMDMALMCDLRFAGRGARFGESYVNVGLVPGDGGCWLLPRIVGTSKALHLLWTGEFIDAEQALGIGLVEEVVDDDKLPEFVHAYAVRLAGQPRPPSA
ncbi:enoyl-CoA hydratase/isomerase family protein [Peterkaempfera bronchialis]|uniref:enoyl-CoA hydratase/isomerase family protein n=1 Tax=Peterkaempfera bronchialis TaxID=2126346 RepID=UPI001E3D5B45|nr:enoyl-CoA hydratase/isomerase family protein [Peterkaempfera bronchialis]